MIKITEDCLKAVAGKFMDEVKTKDGLVIIELELKNIREENAGWLSCMTEMATILFESEEDAVAGVVIAITAYRIFKAQYEAEQMELDLL